MMRARRLSLTAAFARLASVTAIFPGLVLASVLCFAAHGQEPAPDATAAAAFTETIAAQFRRANPAWSVVIAAPLTLTVGRGRAGRQEQVSLDRIYRFCLADPARCAAVSTTFVTRMSASDEEIDREHLRAVIRPAGYVEEARRLTRQADTDLIAFPLIGDLWVMCAFDTPNTIRMAQTRNLETLGMTAEEVLAAASRNVAVALGPVSRRARPVRPGEIGVLGRDPYESSRLLAPQDWRELAARMGSSLLVAAPSAETVLYSTGATPGDIAAMTAAAQEAYRRAERPISSVVLRWTPSGWVSTAP